MNVTARQSSRQQAFAIVETMIVIVILAIVAVLALPLYDDWRLSHWRNMAQAQMRRVGQLQSAHRLENGVFGNLSDFTHYPYNFAYLDKDGLLRSNADADSIYRLSIVRLTGSTVANFCAGSGSPSFDYLIIASPANAQNGDASCMTLCVASNGAKGASGREGPDTCWSP